MDLPEYQLKTNVLHRRLGDDLVAAGLLTPLQLEEAVEYQCIYGGKLGTSLVELGLVEEEQLARVLSQQLKLHYIKPELLMEVSPAILKLVPKHIAYEYKVVPYNKEGRRLFLAMTDATNLNVIDELSFKLDHIIIPLAVPEIRLMLALKKHYGLNLSPRFEALSAQLHRREQARLKQLRKGEAVQQKTGQNFTAAATNQAPNARSQFENRTFDVKSRFDDIAEQLNQRRAKKTERSELLEEPPILQPLAAEPRSSEKLTEENFGETDWPLLGDEEYDEQLPVTEAYFDSATPPSEISITSLSQQLVSANDRNDIARALINFLCQQYYACALFMVRASTVSGWQAFCDGKEPADFRQFTIPLWEHSVFDLVVENKTHYLGMVTDRSHNRRLLQCFNGSPPEAALLIPLLVRDRVVSILYLQDQMQKLEKGFTSLMNLAQKADMAFTLLILKNKILTT